MADQYPNIADQIKLAYDTVVERNNLAEDSYTFAKQQLEVLVDANGELPLALVDITIGDNANISWGLSFSAPETPTEPTYDEPEDPTLPSVTVPASIDVDARPTWGVDLTGTPADLSADSFSALPTLGTITPIDVTLPTMDVTLLEVDPLDDFVEPVYVERVSSQIQTQILSVLGGASVLSQEYWDALYAEGAAKIAREQATATRQARNTGAASYWPLPSEAVLTSARRAQDEGTRKTAQLRLELMKKKAEVAREDLWQAVGQGLAYEQVWLNAHDRVAQRALAAAEQIYSVRVQVHNANIARFNSMLEAAKTDGSIQDLTIQATLAKLDGELRGADLGIRQAGYRLERYKAEWAGWQTDKQTQVQSFAEQIKFWGTQADAHAKYEGLKQGKGKLDLDLLTAQIARVQGLASATAGLLQARTGVANLSLASQKTRQDIERDRNDIEVEVTKLTQAAQEAKARLDITQAQWLEGQALALKNNIAQLAYGYSQAAVNAAQISYGRSIGSSYSQSASQNAELVWS